jgi:hypothetical protein
MAQNLEEMYPLTPFLAPKNEPADMTYAPNPNCCMTCCLHPNLFCCFVSFCKNWLHLFFCCDSKSINKVNCIVLEPYNSSYQAQPPPIPNNSWNGGPQTPSACLSKVTRQSMWISALPGTRSMQLPRGGPTYKCWKYAHKSLHCRARKGPFFAQLGGSGLGLPL